MMPKEEAEKLGAEHEFGAKYPDTVSVYFIGTRDSTFSVEFCGGPHVANTSELFGTFKILKEEASSAGIRRIKAVLE
ncbi:MAG: alanine--tRNA ligase, partial [Candidatus Kaiserbacteria bacterium]|nr:alanine--tRNA ligase [Candidatus Kaiserbacteria bacterium]